jgi:hypothetical protein
VRPNASRHARRSECAAAGAALGGADGAKRRAGAVESAFWEAVCALAGEGRAPPAHVAEALEALAFEALLAQPEPPPGAPPGAHASEEGARVARALGALSRRRFDAVTRRFLAELEARTRQDAHAARVEVAHLCRGLRHLHLPVSLPCTHALMPACPALRACWR